MDIQKTTSKRHVGYLPFAFEDDELKKFFTAEDTEWGYNIVTIYAGADPAKRSPEWHEEQLRAMLGDVKDYRREYAIDWTSASGDVFYPEFSKNPENYVSSAVRVDPTRPVYRGWDFGFRHPACVWFQEDRYGRCVVLREFMPDNIDTHSFRDLVMYLSGQIDLVHVQRRPRAMSWLEKIRQGEWEFQGTIGKNPTPPWFSPTTSYVDYSGPECYMASRIEGEKGERNDYEILAAQGVTLNVLTTRVSAREAVVRRLLLPRKLAEGHVGHGLIIHPSCEVLIGGLAGGIAYKKETVEDPEPTAPAKDGFHEHVHDAFGYGIINVFRVEEAGTTRREQRSARDSFTRIVRSPEELLRDQHKSEEFMDESVLEGGDWGFE